MLKISENIGTEEIGFVTPTPSCLAPGNKIFLQDILKPCTLRNSPVKYE